MHLWMTSAALFQKQITLRKCCLRRADSLLWAAIMRCLHPYLAPSDRVRVIRRYVMHTTRSSRFHRATFPRQVIFPLAALALQHCPFVAHLPAYATPPTSSGHRAALYSARAAATRRSSARLSQNTRQYPISTLATTVVCCLERGRRRPRLTAR
jgi:hypothetical protein